MAASSSFPASQRSARVRQSGARGKTWRAFARLLACLGLLAAACQAAPDPAPAGEAASSAKEATIYVASNGWHSAIVVPRDALPPGVLPEADDFPAADYLSFGWGDAAYFPAREPGFDTTLAAALTPTPSVLHLSGLAAPPHQVFPASEVVVLELPAAGFGRLVAYLDQTFDRDGALRAPSIAPGLHDFSLFYPAEGEFHLFNTCNTWTARALATAGLPVRTGGVVTAEDLMAQVRALPGASQP